jgi:regulator of protease activity HflC (stomatin/prohibitin superfamily)
MPTITRLPILPLRRLRAEPNQLILHFRGGKLVRKGSGIAYWFSPLSAAIAMLPIEDCQSTFVLNEHSADFQSIKVQSTITYRIADAEKAAGRFNFSLSIDHGAWLEQPLDRLASVLAQRALPVVRKLISAQNLETVLQHGSEQVREAVVAAFAKDAEIAAMGLQLVNLVIDQIVPSAELEKALGTPMREAVQTRADEAQFQRRAQAVEKERTIKENELATELELERRQMQLIQKRGENALLRAQQEAASQQAQVEAEIARALLKADAEAQHTRISAQAQADGQQIIAAQEAAAMQQRHQIWAATPAGAATAMAMNQMAAKLQTIGHLNITPDMLGQSLIQLLRDQSALE